MSLVDRSSARWRDKLRYETFAFDKHAVIMAVLFLAVQLAAVWLVLALIGAGVESPRAPAAVSGPDGEANTTTGAAWVAGEVIFAGLLLVTIAIYRRVPEWLQKIIRQILFIGVAMYAGVVVGGVNTVFVLELSFVFGVLLLDELDLFWIFNDLFAVVLAILVGAVVGLMFGIVGLVVALVGFALYDHWFANKERWMFSIAEVLLRMRLPVVFIVPDTIRWDWENLFEDFGDDDPSVWGIGMADMALPAALAASVALNLTTPIVLGVLGGTALACFRLRYEMLTKGSGAGMPALTAGAIGGLSVVFGAVQVVDVLTL